MLPGSAEAPQWLMTSWIRSCQAAGATVSEAVLRSTGLTLLDRWNEPTRFYHTVKHLADVLSRVDELAEETHEPDLVRLAAWYHGAVFNAEARVAYANQGGEDEVASAALARSELVELGIAQVHADRVAQLVTALARHKPAPGDFDCAVLCDADMAILASEPQRYACYVRDVRKEYEHIPVADYLAARHRILTKLVDRRSLFASPLAASWEDAARQNLAGELARVEKEISRLPADPAPEG